MITKLKKELKNYLKDKNIVDIFLIGSAVKGKLKPADIDLIILFREKIDNEVIFKLRQKGYHAEPLLVDNLFKSELLFTIIGEGISLKSKQKFKVIKGTIFSFSLKNLDKINKVRFSQAVYGRAKDGLVYKNGGINLGKGCFVVPIKSEYLFRELMMKFNVKYKLYKVLMLNVNI
ncbi:MAG: nucleotidyltransferase domain-containing protein [Candidatus Pacearchaeota archaeon]